MSKLAINPLEQWNCLLAVPKRQMTEEEVKVFAQLNLLPSASMAGLFNQLRQQDKATIVLAHRLDATGWLNSIEPNVIAFCASLCNTPGRVVLWAYTLARMASLQSPVTFEPDSWTDWNAFGNGVPTDEGYAQAWEFQKGQTHGLVDIHAGNLLDLEDCWPKRRAA
jgi:hypothetical protein